MEGVFHSGDTTAYFAILFRRRSQQCSIGSFAFGDGCSIVQRLRRFTTVRISDAGECRICIDRAGDGTVRGFLCEACSAGLRALGWDVERLWAAVGYLDRA